MVDIELLVRRLEKLEERVEAIERVLEIKRVPKTSMSPEGGYGLLHEEFVSY